MVAAWKVSEFREHGICRKPVTSLRDVVSVCVSRWCQGLLHVEKTIENTPREEHKDSIPLQDPARTDCSILVVL